MAGPVWWSARGGQYHPADHGTNLGLPVHARGDPRVRWNSALPMYEWPLTELSCGKTSAAAGAAERVHCWLPLLCACG